MENVDTDGVAAAYQVKQAAASARYFLDAYCIHNLVSLPRAMHSHSSSWNPMHSMMVPSQSSLCLVRSATCFSKTFTLLCLHLQSKVNVLEKPVADLTRPRELCGVATSIDNMDLPLIIYAGGNVTELPWLGEIGFTAS